MILLTRPAKQAAKFRELLGEGVDVIESPVFKITNLWVPTDLDCYSALIFASQNAVNVAAKNYSVRGHSAFVVGKKTAELVKSLGLNVIAAKTNADNLTKSIIAANPKGKLLFMRGRYSTGDIEKHLISSGIETDSAVIYEQEPVDLTPEAVAALRDERPIILPLFSPRSAQLLSRQTNEINATAPLIITAISEAVLDAWDGPDPAKVSVAQDPTAQAMAEETLRRMR